MEKFDFIGVACHGNGGVEKLSGGPWEADKTNRRAALWVCSVLPMQIIHHGF